MISSDLYPVERYCRRAPGYVGTRVPKTLQKRDTRSVPIQRASLGTQPALLRRGSL